MEDRLSELLAKLDQMKDAQVALQDKLASTRQKVAVAEGDPGEAGEVAGAAAEEGPRGAGLQERAGSDLVDHHDSTSATTRSSTTSAQRLGAFSGLETDSEYKTEATQDAFNMYGMKRDTLLVAAEGGDLQTLRTAIAGWEDDSYLMNESLYLAAAQGHLPCADYLVQHNADCNYWHSSADETVLTISAANGHVHIMEFLRGQGVKPDKPVSGDKHTALHAAATKGQTESVRFLIDSGCDINAKDTFGLTPMMAACKEGQVEVLKMLLAAKADTSLKTRAKKQTAFALAFEHEQAACVQELLLACPEEAKNPLKGGLLPLHHAIRHGKDELVCALVDGGIDLNLADGPWTPIHLAVEMSNIPIVGILAACGADINAHLPVPKKVTILMLAVCKENEEMVRAIGSQATCNLNQFDELGRTALYLAAKFGYVKCVEVLLEICADVDAYAAHMVEERKAGGQGSLPAPTALHATILNDHSEVAALLLAAGCQTDMGAIFEEDGITNVFTPLHVACLKKCQWAVDMLLDAGTPVPDDFVGWCKTNGLDAAITAHIEAAVADRKKNPGMLKKVCRGYIRDSLGTIDMYSKIKGLDVPFGIKEYLLFRDLDAHITNRV